MTIYVETLNLPINLIACKQHACNASAKHQDQINKNH